LIREGRGLYRLVEGHGPAGDRGQS
jgi:hypothetical protein